MVEESYDFLTRPGQPQEIPEREDLIDDFFESQEFLDLYGMLEKQMRGETGKPGKYRGKEPKGDFLGVCFEELGYKFLENRLATNHSLTSPVETLTYFKKHIYPQRKLINKAIGLTTLSDVYVPDGLVFESKDGAKGKLRAIVDYTTSLTVERLEKKLKGLNELKAANPALFSNVKLFIISPLNGDDDEILAYLTEHPDLVLEFFPCSKKVVRNRMLEKYRQLFRQVFPGKRC